MQMLRWPLSQWLPGGDYENFESLPKGFHFALPVIGALILGLIYHRIKPRFRPTGIAHVIGELHQGHSSKLPIGNAIVQFFGAIISLFFGFSGGREGPAVHLGASGSSYFGQKLRLPDNSLRVMASCGTAAAIAASFNTPIAGVIFAMEVVMMEYTVTGFIPVILAAVSATVLTRIWHGDEIALANIDVALGSLHEMPYIALTGLAIGVLSACFVYIQRECLKLGSWAIWRRFLLAGVVTGTIALLSPEIMGLGFDTFAKVFAGEFNLQILLILLVSKLLATSIAHGLGVPIGIIGPSLIIGALGGAAMGQISVFFPIGGSAEPSFYALLGMAAMMAALMNAPLAALLAILELTNNPQIIFPAMLAIIVAHITHKELFKLRSSPQTTLDSMHLWLRTDPITQSLLRTSALAVMESNVATLPIKTNKEELNAVFTADKKWLLLETEAQTQKLLNHAELEALLSGLEEGQKLDLSASLAEKPELAELDILSTLREALDLMNESKQDAILVTGFLSDNPAPEIGILSRAAIEKHYNNPIIY